MKPIAQHVTGFCAKDCGAVKGDVMIQFGTGKVNFAGVFAVLKAAGFDGPLMVECCKVGATAEETMANARANREFLEERAGEGVSYVATAISSPTDRSPHRSPRRGTENSVAPSATAKSCERQTSRAGDVRLALARRRRAAGCAALRCRARRS